jgi:hypothetical protein
MLYEESNRIDPYDVSLVGLEGIWNESAPKMEASDFLI